MFTKMSWSVGESSISTVLHMFICASFDCQLKVNVYNTDVLGQEKSKSKVK